MSKERARLDMACMSQALIIIALRKQAKELERAELARCAEECEKQSEYEGGLLDRIAELEKVLALVKKDLLMRAEEDSNGCKVVDLSSSIWIKLTEALKEDK